MLTRFFAATALLAVIGLASSRIAREDLSRRRRISTQVYRMEVLGEAYARALLRYEALARGSDAEAGVGAKPGRSRDVPTSAADGSDRP